MPLRELFALLSRTSKGAQEEVEPRPTTSPSILHSIEQVVLCFFLFFFLCFLANKLSATASEGANAEVEAGALANSSYRPCLAVLVLGLFLPVYFF
jgi:succinate dehydrogenase/fumarate reductase cytochrome b subunit